MSIPSEILDYLTAFLEISHPNFGNLPPCPFAKKERIAGRILCQKYPFTKSQPTQDFLTDIRTFDENPAYSTLIAYDETSTLSLEDAYELANQLIETLQDIDILVIPLHPEDPYSPSGVRTRATPYLMFAIQRRNLLSDGQQQLLRTKYYSQFEDQEQRLLQVIEQQCSKKNVFFPLLWWKDEVLRNVRQGEPFPEACPHSTLRMLNSNEIHTWFHQYGRMHHWIPFGSFSKIQEAQAAVSEGRILMATAHGGNKQGYVELLDGQDVYEAFHEPHYIGRFLWEYKEETEEETS